MRLNNDELFTVQCVVQYEDPPRPVNDALTEVKKRLLERKKYEER